ncbi:DJ-1/PfpI family protein [Pedobacter antarcticus]|uniref:DJ-1/PfpI family protein n=1 Tax=Pedobacter antarcticus TaxID=34086 RepID=UPI00088A0E9F|nr:DJ-1/PfpI family protein [Pedobacter antarcticus]SDL37486.1 DJ-1/PfpI family protein [Pedobacter antarcticus]
MKTKEITNNNSNNRRGFIKAATLLGAAYLYPMVSFADTSPGLNSTLPAQEKLVLGMVVFDGFQLLDVFGPLDIFGSLRDKISIIIIGEKGESVKSSAGPVLKLDYTFSNAPKIDILMIPGGGGTRREVKNEVFLKAVKVLAESAPQVATICTGSAVLAKTGLLDGHRATTNKRAYAWATSQSDKVTWVPEARWVEDGKFFTSSGISAGIDMALGLISKMFGKETAVRIANGAEYIWNDDPNRDPFAKMNGLIK